MDEINLILENYNIEVNKLSILDKGYASKKWKVDSCDNFSYIIKKINKQNIERMKFILNVQDKLQNYSPKIIRTNNSNLFYSYNDNVYYMYKYVEARPVILNLQKLNEIGIFLSILHTNMKNIKIKKSSFIKIKNNRERLNYLLEYYIKNEYRDLIDIINYKINVLNNIQITDVNFDNLNEQIIHGDFYIDNILFDGKNYTMIDFDQCCHFYKEYEILRAMFMLCLDRGVNKKNILKNMKNFINGYYVNSVINSPIDAFNLYLYIQANSLSGLNIDEKDDDDRRKFAVKRYKILRFLYENKYEILSILGGSNDEKANTSFSSSL